MSDQLPPHNLDFERSILSSCFHYQDDLAEFIALLKPTDFYSTRHQIIFEKILQLHTENKPVELNSVYEKISSAGLQEKTGGAEYLSSLFDEPISVNCSHYAETIKGHAIRRRLIEIGNAIMKTGHQKDTAPGELLDKCQQLVLSVQNSNNGGKVSSISELVTVASDRYECLYQNPGETTGISSGFKQLDLFTCGFQPSDLVIIAARPSMGKTALMVNIVDHAASNNNSVGIFSLEMSEDQITDRFISAESGVNLLKFRSGKFDKSEWEKIHEAQAKFYEKKIFIDDTGGLSYGELRRRARKMKLKHKIDIFFIDYLQLMAGDKKHGRVEEISSISRNLKAMAKELEVPVICLSQLNRALEIRDNKRPRLSDLRDSGAIEQDADTVLFIYRPEVYKKGDEHKGVTELIIGKQRNGPTKTIGLYFNKTIAKFFNLAVAEA
jgi:replicative DNA helicase